jgi:hypothetical protein
LLHHVVGPISAAVYGAHSDCSPLLNSFPKNEYQHVHDDVYLPVPGEMQVLMIHYSNYKSAVKDDHCTMITYTCDDELVGSAPLSSRGIHIQGPGSQLIGMKHTTTVSKSARKSGIYRCVCTTRLSLSPSHGKAFKDAMELTGIDLCKQSVDCTRSGMSHDKISVVTLSKYGHITQSGLRTTSPTSQIPEANGVGKATKNKKRKHAKLQNQPNPRRPKKTVCISYKDSLLPFSERYANVTPNIFDEYGINRGVPIILRTTFLYIRVLLISSFY